MSAAASQPPSDATTPTQNRSLFHHEARKHECHHYMRTYGGQALNAFVWGFGATLGADAANAAFGEARVSFFSFFFHFSSIFTNFLFPLPCLGARLQGSDGQ